MKRIAIINETFDGSHGKIAKNLFYSLQNKGYKVSFYYGRGQISDNKSFIRITNRIDFLLHVFLSRITGLPGHFSNIATSRLINRIKNTSVDTVIILNLHGYYVNESRLLSYVARTNLRLLYIMADEYTYLGKCAVSPICKNYITKEGRCPNIHLYPSSWFFDTCHYIIEEKERCYKQLKRAAFIGPEFVVQNARRSYLGQFMNLKVLDEAIDTDFYKPQDANHLKNKLRISPDAVIILCIAPYFKGVEYFELLSQKFVNNSNYVFLHVGKGPDVTHDNYIHVDFVKENKDLAIYYSLADLFVFPSMADTMSNACLESLSCGTPLLVFNISGMPYLLDESVGTLVAPRNVEEMTKVVLKVSKKNKETIDKCREYALKRYSSKDYADKVITIANQII